MAETLPLAALDVASLRSRVERRFRVYDVQSDEHVVAFFVDAPRETLETDFDALKRELKLDGLIPLLKYQGGEHAIYILRNPTRTRRSWKVNLTLFLLTILTTTLVGSASAMFYYSADGGLTDITREEYYLQVFSAANLLRGFLVFSLPLLGILTVHEFGHYYYARKHGVDASLPFFLPVPPLIGIAAIEIGTFGAFISMREPMPNRKALFDIGVAGPLAGLAVAIPVLLIGFALSAASNVQVGAADNTITLGTPLLFDWLQAPFGMTDDVLIHPVAYAGWVGLLVTSINLLPAGQLDGGHIAAAMFGERARYTSYAAVLGLFAIGIAPAFGFPGFSGWLLFAVLIGFLGIRHPPTLDGVSGIDQKRMIIGWATFAIGILCFTLVPVLG
ncbi:MAG TPA: site-2 protease family protein [Candidatus Thermoplasmatota archaeon]|nr:site-2 protease family protein [Candidatus Thermoplasmatota archaeon]